jgi:hypothetical protein
LIDAINRLIHRYRCDTFSMTPGRSLPEVCRS